jgi:hypothetical protein
MISESVATVRTSGINWESVLTIVFGSVATLSIVLGFLLRFTGKYISDKITGAIDRLRIDVLLQIDRRVVVLETLAGIKTATAEEEKNAVRSEEKRRIGRLGSRQHRDRGSQGDA